jgi:hypothetical protein
MLRRWDCRLPGSVPKNHRPDVTQRTGFSHAGCLFTRDQTRAILHVLECCPVAARRRAEVGVERGLEASTPNGYNRTRSGYIR